MPKRLPASLVEIVLRSAIAGWIAALYGALYIYAKADLKMLRQVAMPWPKR